MTVYAEEWVKNVKTYSTSWTSTPEHWTEYKREKIKRAKQENHAYVVDFSHDKFSIYYEYVDGSRMYVNIYTRGS